MTALVRENEFRSLCDFCRYWLGHHDQRFQYPYPSEEPTISIDLVVTESKELASVCQLGDAYRVELSIEYWLRLIGFCRGALVWRSRLLDVTQEEREELIDSGIPDALQYRGVVDLKSDIGELKQVVTALEASSELAAQVQWPFWIDAPLVRATDDVAVAASFGLMWAILHEVAHIDREHIGLRSEEVRLQVSEHLPWIMSPDFTRSIETEADVLSAKTLGHCLAFLCETGFDDDRIFETAGLGIIAALLLLEPDRQMFDGLNDQIYDVGWMRTHYVDRGLRSGLAIASNPDTTPRVLMPFATGEGLALWFAEALGNGLRAQLGTPWLDLQTFLFLHPQEQNRRRSYKEYMIEYGFEALKTRDKHLKELSAAFPRNRKFADIAPHGRYGGMRLYAHLRSARSSAEAAP